ncbi:AIPR family protein [Psychrobacter glacincola]|uniref:AIPR family protein n=1 Tax=Psychrobacter glacincola TaxID=56810 RepID=A0ABW1W5K2_9GAMM|nr:AIPR family protein [Psychrobacter glacincola]|tara:strand:+ start:608 stop:2302 length:1695 start_codon:yes stop_codon:yes gene_type:complete
MANLNDFKVIKRKSAKSFKLLTEVMNINTDALDLTQIERLGFYLFIIEHITGVSDVFDVTDIVTDTEFNKLIFNNNFDDFGLDAIYINEDEKHIQLFNFKYRESFKVGKQSVNSTILSSKFINALTTENTSSLKGKIKIGAEDILKKLTSNDEYKITLYVVSNEEIEIKNKDAHLTLFEQSYGLEIVPIGLEEISQFVTLRPKPVHAELIVDNDAIMSFSESSISSSKSYILRLPLSEIVRITCDDHNLRASYSIEDLTPLSKVKIDISVLFDNVRGLVLKSKYNQNIYDSLKEDPSKFFMFNNGLTLTANDIKAESVNANKKVKISLNSIQVLNGGQSLRTIHSFNASDPNYLEDYLSNSEVLVRVFNTSKNSELNNKIAEYTNSQNSIANVDLKSLRSEQLSIEQFLNEHDIVYARKTGDTGLDDNKNYKHKISMEKFGQILISVYGMPDKATNQKKEIFNKYYDTLFVSDWFNIEDSPTYIEEYFQTKKEYEKTNFIASDQKLFYMMYLSTKLEMDIIKLINFLEKSIQSYQPLSNKNVTEARKLIQSQFKKYLDEQIALV